MSEMYRREFLPPDVEAMANGIEEVLSQHRWRPFPLASSKRRKGVAYASAQVAAFRLRQIMWDEPPDEERDEDAGVPVA